MNALSASQAGTLAERCGDCSDCERVSIMGSCIIAFGESNAGGLAPNASASAGELASRSEVKMWNVNTSTFENLDIGTNNNLDHAGGITSTTHGWELQLANDVASGVWPEPVYYVQTGQGGSRISDWGVVGTYWSKFLTRVNGAKSYFSTNSIAVDYYVWFSLGINDFNGGLSTSSYRTGIETLIAQIKSVSPTAKFILTELPFATTYNPFLRLIANSDSAVTFAAVSGAALLDSYHWSYAGMKSVSSELSYRSLIFSGQRAGKIFDFHGFVNPADARLSFNGPDASIASGCTSKSVFADLDAVIVPTQSNGDQVVVGIESTKETSHTWPNTMLCGFFTLSGLLYRWTSTSASLGAVGARTRLRRSGNDVLIETDNNDNVWTVRHTFTGVLSGVSTPYLHVVNAGQTTTDFIDLQTVPVIQVGTPTSGTRYLVGETVPVSWTTGAASTVNIKLSLNNGSTFPITLASGASNTGSYNYTPTADHITSQAVIKVENASNSNDADNSDAFVIATTTATGGSGSNTTEWAAVREMLSSAGVELIRV